MDLRDIARALKGEVLGQQVLAPGPNHSSRDRSLAVSIEPNAPDGFIVFSHSGDDPLMCKDYVREKIGMPAWKPDPDYKSNGQANRQANGKAESSTTATTTTRAVPVCHYVYQTASGTPYLRVTRMSDKKFLQSHWDGSQWRNGKPAGPKIPYRLPDLLADPTSPVFVVEGEKDADRLVAEGLLATTASEGAGKWTADVAAHLAGRKVFIIQDNDRSGQRHTDQILSTLPNAILLTLTGLPDKGDVSDWLDLGHAASELMTLHDAPIPRPASPSFTEDDIDPGTPITEDLGARLFAAKYANRLAYCHDQGRWFQFDGSIWRGLHTPLAFHYAREMARRLSLKSNSVTTIQKTRFAAGVEQFSRADPVFARTADFWDTDPFLMGTPDGTVDLRTGWHRDAIPSDNITKATAISPHSWADCPTWLEFLRVTTGDDENLVRFLQQICGYALTGDTREHALFFVYGPGGNGKSVFVNTISKIIGDYAMAATMDTFAAKRHSSIPSDIAMMRGARLVTASETAENEKWDQQRIAQLTGGDAITARFLRQEFFTFKPQFSLIFIGNHKPALASVDDAMRRRFNIIPFLVKPNRPDRQLEEKLIAEWPAILRWMIDGCLDWQANGLVRPAVVTEATQDYFEDQNTMQQWLDQECEVDVRSWTLCEKSGELFASWVKFCRAAGDDPGTSKSFKPALEKMGLKFKRDPAGRWFHGVQLKRVYEDEHG